MQKQLFAHVNHPSAWQIESENGNKTPYIEKDS